MGGYQTVGRQIHTNSLNLGQGAKKEGAGGRGRTVGHPSECQLAGVHSPLRDMKSLRPGQCFPLLTTEMAKKGNISCTIGRAFINLTPLYWLTPQSKQQSTHIFIREFLGTIGLKDSCVGSVLH